MSRSPAFLLLSVVLVSLAACEDGARVIATNEAPTIQILDPVPGSDGDAGPFSEGEGIVFRAVVDDAEDERSSLIVRWSALFTDAQQDALTLGSSTPDSQGYSDFVAVGLGSGHWLISGQVVDSDQAADEARMPVLIVGPSNAPEVFITAPADGAEIVQGDPATFAATAADDGGPSALTVEWYDSLDGVLSTSAPSMAGLVTFATETLALGEHTLTLTVEDHTGLTATDAVSFFVTPADLPPTQPGVDLWPDAPTTHDDLRCDVTVASVDPDGLPVVLDYVWTRDGSPTSFAAELVPGSETERGELWTCEVTGFDGTLSSASSSDSVTIGNTAPSAIGATLGPVPATEATVLTCAGVGWEDPDGDLPTYQVSWDVNGSPPSGTPGFTLDGAAFGKGDVVTCTLVPDDGVLQGLAVLSNPVVIENTPPTGPSVTVSPQPVAADGDPLTCSISAPGTDVDSDLLTEEVRWSIDGSWDPTWDGSWTVPASATWLGEDWTCEARSWDGSDGSGWVGTTTSILPSPGDLVIAEFMPNPSLVTDVAGEWVEIYNAVGSNIDLDGFELHDDGSDSHLIQGPLVIGPGGRVVLARNFDSGSNGGVAADYEYSGFSLNDGTDQLVLSFVGVEIDRFNYDLSAYPGSLWGHSATLDPSLGAPSALANDAPTAWCASSNPMSGLGSDFGTPGGPNDNCQCGATDADGDGFGDGPTCSWWDCDDSDAAVHPGGIEVCGNGIDEDCVGGDSLCSCASSDNDGDGFGDGPACNPLDCNDANAFVFPTASESCNNVDDDCDGLVDEGYDSDGDGWTTCENDCNNSVASIYPGAAESCNNVDDDCDGGIDEGFDVDTDGYSTCENDCNDNNASIHPGLSDTCNIVDDDCDGSIDENAPGDVFENNATSSAAYYIGGNETIVDLWGTFHSSSDNDDWYWINTTDDFDLFCDLFYVAASLDSIPSGTDYDIYLYNGSLTLIDYSFNVNNASESTFWEPGCASPGDDGGPFYIQVSRWSGSSCSDTYHLQVENGY